MTYKRHEEVENKSIKTRMTTVELSRDIKVPVWQSSSVMKFNVVPHANQYTLFYITLNYLKVIKTIIIVGKLIGTFFGARDWQF